MTTHERVPESLLDLVESPLVVDDTLLTGSDPLDCQLSIRWRKETSASGCIGNEDEKQDSSSRSRTTQDDVYKSPSCYGELAFGIGGIESVCETGSENGSKRIGRHPDT